MFRSWLPVAEKPSRKLAISSVGHSPAQSQALLWFSTSLFTRVILIHSLNTLVGRRGHSALLSFREAGASRWNSTGLGSTPHCPPHGLANRSAFSSPCHTPWVPLCYFLQISKGGLVNCICLTQKRPQMSNRILVFLVKPLQTILNPAVSTASLLGTEAHFGHGDAHRGVRECVREEPTHLARLMMHV